MSSPDYEVQLGRDASSVYEALPARVRNSVRSALQRLAAEQGRGERGGKRIKTIRGARDTFHRLRVGDYRIIYDVIHEDRVILVLGLIHRGDLERWLRSR